MRLSIGRALGETKTVLSRDGGLIAAVALALVVLPGVLVGLAAPATAGDAAAWTGPAALIAGLISLAGQLAISRIALGPQTTVGEAIKIGFQRLPAFLGAMLMWVLPFLLAMIAFFAAIGVNVATPSAPIPKLSGAATLVLLILMLAFLYVAIRMLLTTPAAAGTKLGPIALMRHSWGASRGNALRLFGLLVLVLILGMVVVVGLGSAIGSVVLLALGEPRPWSSSALIVAVVQQVLNAIISIVLAVLVARLYAQVAGDAAADRGGEPVSVPSARAD